MFRLGEAAGCWIFAGISIDCEDDTHPQRIENQNAVKKRNELLAVGKVSVGDLLLSLDFFCFELNELTHDTFALKLRNTLDTV